jgi:hypothetical protein
MQAAFPALFALGAAALALWIDERAATARPDSVTRRIGHALVAVAGLYAVSAVIGRYGEDSGTSTRLLMLFAAVLPVCVYLFVTAAWLVRTLVDVAQLCRR